jgi:predicted transcriptional regulator
MTIELPREIETQLKDTAAEQGVSVSQYLETLVRETNLRRKQLAEFRAAIAERVASLDAGEVTDGEEVMARLISGLASR